MNEPVVFNRQVDKERIPETGAISFDLKRRRTRIDSTTASMMKAKSFMFAHFVYIDGTYFMIVNNDKTGYKFIENNRKGLEIANTRMIRHFFLKNHIKSEKVIYSLIPAEGKEWKGSPMYEIFRRKD
jgi:hypothetical protein